MERGHSSKWLAGRGRYLCGWGVKRYTGTTIDTHTAPAVHHAPPLARRRRSSPEPWPRGAGREAPPRVVRGPPDAKARGAAIIGIFHDEAARTHVCDREIDVGCFTPGMVA